MVASAGTAGSSHVVTTVASSMRGLVVTRVVQAVTVLFFATLMILPQSYFEVRVSLLGAFLVTHAILVAVRGKVRVLAADVLFYGLIAFSGLVWAVIGLAKGGDLQGVLASAKLYSAWSLAYLVIVTLFRNFGRIELIHAAVVFATACICIVNVLAVVDAFLQKRVFPDAVIKELGMYVGFYGGYARLHANNIASMFFLWAT